jgi:spermidine synthase
MSQWYDEVFEEKSRFGLKIKRALFHAKSEFQTVDIIDTELFGKVLALDGTFQTSVKDEYYYHEMLVHPALTTTPEIKRVLVIGGGDGGSVREVLRYPDVERVTMVEIDGVVVDACKEHLPEIGRAWRDPRLELLIQDGVAYLEKVEPESLDVIIVDGPDPVGPAVGLFKQEFYQCCLDRLTKQGVLAVQSESPHVMQEAFFQNVSELNQVFRIVNPYFGPVPIYPSSGWSYIYASNEQDPLKIIDQRIDQIERGCRYYNRDIHRSAFALPNEIKQRLGAK